MLQERVVTAYSYDNTIESLEEIEDNIVKSWFLMNRPVIMTSIMLAYLFIVLKFGPENMKNRSPFNIKYIVLAYNLLQVLFNIKIVSKLLEAIHMYFVAKVVDLLDTVFFVMKKKQSHVSFLHVYHHTIMAIVFWVYLNYFRSEDIIIVVFLNSFVHVVMYAYYFLAGLGPHMQKYLWWKKYITTMQLIQFAIVFSWMVLMVYYKCSVSNYTFYLSVWNTFIFFYLFTLFYIKSYCKTEETSSINKKSKTFNEKLAYCKPDY